VEIVDLLESHLEHLEETLEKIGRHGKQPALVAEVLSRGELFSSAIGTRFLRKIGMPAAWLDARQFLRCDGASEQAYLSATCDCSYDEGMRAELEQASEKVFLTQGFIATNSKNETVLLGRGGSDTSAAYLAAKMGADSLEIWTDVPGMFSANPHAVPEARLLRRMHYEEAELLAGMGAKVLHPRCIDPLRQVGIPLQIKSTLAPQLEGSVICDEALEHTGPKSIATRNALYTIATSAATTSMEGLNLLSSFTRQLSEHALNVHEVNFNGSRVTATVSSQINSAKLSSSEIKAAFKEFGEVEVMDNRGTVSLVGRQVHSVLPEISSALGGLEDYQLALLGDETSSSQASFLVEQAQTGPLLRMLHDRFFSSSLPSEVFGQSWKKLKDLQTQTTVSEMEAVSC
jgi:diaminopimelate decarboxylase/aspartate kinase